MMLDTPLGQKIDAPKKYDPKVLFPIARSQQRAGIDSNVKFQGVDIWQAYEISWLNTKGKPEVAIGRFIFDANSENIIESKSLKLYLNSFNNSFFENAIAVRNIIKKDLSDVSKSEVEVELYSVEDEYKFFKYDGICLDSLDVEINYEQEVDRSYLKKDSVQVKEKLYTNLFKANCLVTNQADWASVYIEYEGDKIDPVGLLQYLISYRNCNSFHERCIERIYADLFTIFEPHTLTVYAKFTRRGGLDIEPYRTNSVVQVPSFTRTTRQ